MKKYELEIYWKEGCQEIIDSHKSDSRLNYRSVDLNDIFRLIVEDIQKYGEATKILIRQLEVCDICESFVDPEMGSCVCGMFTEKKEEEKVWVLKDRLTCESKNWKIS